MELPSHLQLYWMLPKLLSKVIAPFVFTRVGSETCCLHSFLPTLGILQHFNLLLCVKWYIMVILSSISLTISKDEHLSMCVLDILASFYVKCLYTSGSVEHSYLQTTETTLVEQKINLFYIFIFLIVSHYLLLLIFF